MPETARRSSGTRQAELTDAALQIIATRGIAALTTRSLATEVGLSTGAIFRHYATLDALLEAVVERVEAVLEATYPSSSMPPLERLRAFVEARATAVGQRKGILRLLLSDQFQLALPREGSRRLRACVEQTGTFVATCLHDAQAAGHVRRDLDTAALAPIVMGTVQMLALTPAKADPHATIAALFTVLRPPLDDAQPFPKETP